MDKTRVKLFLNFTRHHLITHTNLIIRKLSVKCLFLNNVLNFTHHGHFNVIWVHTSPISFVRCRKVSLFHLFACNKLKEIADTCMQAWRMSLTKTVCQTLSLMLIIDSLTLLYNWHHWYRCCEIWDLSTLADKLRIVFETSQLKISDNFVFEKFTRTENYLLLTLAIESVIAQWKE